MNVLAVVCHPDDMELNCGGTLLRCKKRGDNVTVCHVANGNMGHLVIMPDELREIRAQESQDAGKVGGFKIVTCDVDDLTICRADTDQHDRLVKIIREAKPDFIITHGPDDYMIDHTDVSKLTFAASFSASCPHYKPELGDATPVTPIYYMENFQSVGTIPTEYVDITDEIDDKLAMLACHKSQSVWLKDHDNVDILEDTRAYARFRGMQCHVKYAEGFRQCIVGERMTTRRLLP